MTRTRILFAIVLVAGAIGVAATYFLGIVPRLASYEEVKQEEAQLRKRITELEETFDAVKPQRAIGAWSDQVQPWTVGLSDRLDYFDSVGELERIEVPEEEADFPKFFYRRVLPELVQSLEDDAFNAGTSIPQMKFGTPNPTQVDDPSVEEVETWLNDYQAGAEFVRVMIDAKATEVGRMTIADPVTIIAVPEGQIQLERLRYQVKMSTESLVEFLSEIHDRENYFAIEGFQVTNKTVSDPNRPLEVDLAFIRTRFIPALSEDDSGAAPATILRRVSQNAGVGGAGGGPGSRIGRGPQYTEEELKKIRAATQRDTNPSFFQSVLRWFGF